MSIFAPLMIRTLGPVVVLASAGALLAPLMSQPSKLYRNTDIVQMIGQQLWPTLLLIALAIVLATAIWLPLAVLTARRGYRVGLTVAPISVLAQALAPFWTAIVVVLLFGTPARPMSAGGASIVGQALLPASALAVVLLGFLAHATYLRAVSKQSLAAESDVSAVDPGDVRLEIAEDWLNTIGRYAGLLIGALVLIEAVFKRPGIGRAFVDGLQNADIPFRSVALFFLIVLSFALTVLFGVGADLVRARLDRRRAAMPVRLLADGPSGSFAGALPEPRWLAVLTVALGGLIVIVLVMLMTSLGGQANAAPADATLLSPGSAGHAFGTDSQGRDVLTRIAAGVRENLWQLFWLVFTAYFAVPLALAGSRLGRGIEGLVATALDGALIVSPLITAALWMAGEPKGTGPHVIIGYAIGPLLTRLICDAVRAVWSGEQRDASAAFGAVFMGLLVGASYAVTIDASLNFLGFVNAAQGGALTPTLGGMVASGSPILARAPWLAIYPGVVLTALASSLILIGYGTLGLVRSRPTPAIHADAGRLAEA